MIWLWIILTLVALAALGYLAWISIQSLMQASLLRSAAKADGRTSGSDRPAAIHGPLTVVDPLNTADRRNLIWYRTIHEERRGWGKNRRWVTVGREEEAAPFQIESGGRQISVNDHPTEVQGAESKTQYGEGGFFGMFSNQRSKTRWLPVTPTLTVLGRLESNGDEGEMVKSPKVGLLFSPHEPSKAAMQETFKGIAGLIGVGIGIGVVIWLWVNS